MSSTAAIPTEDAEAAAVASAAALAARGRAAMATLTNASQARVDEAVTAIAWAIYDPANAHRLAELAVEDTGLGNVADKIIKNQRKTFGTLRDLMRVRTVGVIEDDPAKGLVKYAKPVGVVAAVTPSTNPAATPVNKTMMGLKGRNAVVVAPSPSGYATTSQTVELMRGALTNIGLPADLIQILPQPVSKASTQALMEAVDLVVVTGSQNNVKRAYTSGTPAIGVGAGNVPVIIDESADLDDAAAKICASKTFDNATSCSSENSVIIPASIFDEAIKALEHAGGYLCDAQAKSQVHQALWPKGHLSRELIAKDADVFAKRVGLPEASQTAKFFMVEDDEVGDNHPFSGEKLSLVLTVYKVADFAAAQAKVQEVLDHEGMGH
jgi:sulfoacetaldehyde dehydrogenase